MSCIPYGGGKRRERPIKVTMATVSDEDLKRIADAMRKASASAARAAFRLAP